MAVLLVGALAAAVVGMAGPAHAKKGPSQPRIAFTGGPGGLAYSSQLFTMPSGGGVSNTNISNQAGYNGHPSWSPSGKLLVFQRKQEGQHTDIWTMGETGAGKVNLTDGQQFSEFGFLQPDWSPNGFYIAAVAVNGPVASLVTMNKDGGEKKSVGGLFGHDPDWSPDGKRLVFASRALSAAGTDLEVYTVNPNGTGLANITNSPTSDERFPAWSPDGKRIAFTTTRDGNSEIYLMNPDGTGATNVTNHPADDQNPAWSPGGTYLLFDSPRVPKYPNLNSSSQMYPDIFRQRVGGTELLNLTTKSPNRGTSQEAAWQPHSGCTDCLKVTESKPKLSARQFSAARSGSSIGDLGSRRSGSIVAYTLSHPAVTTFEVVRVSTRGGRRSPCVPAGKRKRSRRRRKRSRGAACKRSGATVGSFTHKGEAGENKFRFTGRIRRRRLAPGNYRLLAAARDLAGNRGRSVPPVGFKIVR